MPERRKDPLEDVKKAEESDEKLGFDSTQGEATEVQRPEQDSGVRVPEQAPPSESVR